MTDVPAEPMKVPTGRLKHPDIAMLEGYLDRLQGQIHQVQEELSKLKATDDRQTQDLLKFQEALDELKKEFGELKGKIESMADDQKATRASQARTEASLGPIQADLTALKKHVSKAVSLLALVDLLVKLLIAYHHGG